MPDGILENAKEADKKQITDDNCIGMTNAFILIIKSIFCKADQYPQKPKGDPQK